VKLKVVDPGGCVAVPRSIGDFKPRRVVPEHGFRTTDTEAHADPLSPAAGSAFCEQRDPSESDGSANASVIIYTRIQGIYI